MSAVSVGVSEVLIKYTGKYVKIYFIIKITFFLYFFGAVDELERYLDPSYGEAFELSDSLKLDLVLAREEHLRCQQQQLNTMHSLKTVLDSQHISGTVREEIALSASGLSIVFLFMFLWNQWNLLAVR